MNQILNKFAPHGYVDCFYQGEDIWGFFGDGVMPVPVPKDIVDAAKQQDIRDRLADWPAFGQRQRFKFWRDRVWRNLEFKLNRRGARCFKVGNVAIKDEQTLILGHYILCRRFKNGGKHSQRDLLYSLLGQWLERTSAGVRHWSWPKYSFVIDSSRPGDKRVLALSVRDEEAYHEYHAIYENLDKSISTWVICNCDRDLADIVSKETGFPACYFYALPSHLFWVYSKQERTLILGQIRNKEGFWKILTVVWSMIYPRFRNPFILAVAIALLPRSPAGHVLFVLLSLMLCACLAFQLQELNQELNNDSF